MAIEIERKFRLKDASIIEGLKGARLKQAYLGHGPLTVRVRIEDDQAVLALKGAPSGLSRLELEYPIPLEDANTLVAQPGVTSLTKTRYLVQVGAHTYEVDQYHGALEGLFTVEVELASVDEKVHLPAWVGEELTGQRSWDNESLARYGMPDNAPR